MTEQELLAVVWGIKKFRRYLHGRFFVVKSDHQLLQGVMRLPPDKPARMHRWMQFLGGFNFKIDYKKGTENQMADNLSRFPVEAIGVQWEDEDRLKELQRQDRELNPFYVDAMGMDLPQDGDFLVATNGVLYRCTEEEGIREMQAVVPFGMRDKFHRLGHPGAARTLKVIRRKF